MLKTDGLLEPLTIIPKFEPVDKASEVRESLVLYVITSCNRMWNNSEMASSQPVVLSRFKTKLEKWSVKFEYLLSTSAELNNNQEMAIHQLKVRYRMSLILVQAFLFEDEMAFDDFESDFRCIIEASRKFISQCHELVTESKRQVMFVSSRDCSRPSSSLPRVIRHPSLRRKAAELLGVYDCQEGLWRTDAAFRFRSLTADIEEQGLSEVRGWSDIP